MVHRIAYFLCTFGVVGFSAALGVLFYSSEQPWVDFSVLEHYDPGKPSLLLDDQGNEWGRFEYDKREIIKYEQLPLCVIHAFLAAEDWYFFDHSGLSYKGIVRSALINLTSLRRAQGASTITQQLVRLLFFETQKNFTRKVKEQILALVVEQQFTKQQILETYLNHIYLGAGIYGVEAACQRFWGISIKNCSPDQAAVLGAIVRYPRKYCPLYDLEASKGRRNLILHNMHKLNFITTQEYEEARSKPVACVTHNQTNLGAHIKETLRLFLEEKFGKKKLYTSGLKIQTTLNRRMQHAAEKVFKRHMAIMHKQFTPELEGAFVCIEGSTGAIKALIGGCNFNTSQFNRALQAKRQMGSTFKPLVFAQALAHGKSFTSVEIDEPFSLTLGGKEWTPGNAAKTFDGPMTLAHALSRSNNIVTIKAFIEADPHKVVELAKACDLNPTHAYPSLALGSLEATPLQTVSMMNIFGQHGQFVEPYSIVWVKDQWGNKLYRSKPKKKQVLLPLIADQVARVLTLRIEQARKRSPKLFCPCDALGKSGTTNDSRTTSYVGSTPRYTTAVYIGFDDNRSLGNTFGSRTAFPIWRDFNEVIKQKPEKFSYDAHLEEVTIDSITGEPCAGTAPNAVSILVPQVG